MTFVPFVPVEDFPDDVLYEITDSDGNPSNTLNLFHTVIHSPAVFDALTDATRITLTEMKLDAELRELVICNVARVMGGYYPYNRHVIVARSMKISDDKLIALPTFEQHPIFSDTEKAALAYSDELARTYKVSPATKARVEQYFDYRQRVELTWTIGFYFSVGLITNAWEVPIEVQEPTGLPRPRKHAG